MLKTLGRTKAVLETAGFLVSSYLRLVRRTNRFVFEPAGFLDTIRSENPFIVAMWHGQHVMVPYIRPYWPKGMGVSALVSRHGDGEINAVALRRLGIDTIRGSGGKRISAKVQEHGGSAALREMARQLAAGTVVAMTADVPKVSRRVGPGIVTLARMTGRPIYPIAVVTSRRFDFRSWDRASLGKPFGRGAMVLGSPIHVERDADAAALERARLAVEDGLDRVHARAYGLVGAEDPGRPAVPVLSEAER